MARTPAVLPGGMGLSDYLSIGVIARVFPLRAVQAVLRESGRASRRRREGGGLGTAGCGWWSGPRGVKSKMSKFKVRHRGPLSREIHPWEPRILDADP